MGIREYLRACRGGTESGLTVQTAGESGCGVKACRAAIYARLSYETEANRERDTIDMQIAYLKNFIDRQEDMELADVYAEM